MRIAFGNDHAGLPLREAVIDTIQASGAQLIDFGIPLNQPVDYPDITLQVCESVNSGKADRGILICGSGVGVCIAANKIKGIYASVCHDSYSAHQSVEHDGMNVLCLGGKIIGSELARELVLAFIKAIQSDDERHVRRRNKIKMIEDR